MAAKLISFVCFLLFSKAFYLHIFWIPFPLSLLAFHIATLEAGAHNVGTSFPCFIISFRLGNLKRLKDSKVRLLLVLSGWALMVSCFFFFFACIIHKYSIERTSGFSTAYCSFRPSCTIGCLVAHKPSRSQSQLPPAPLPASQTASTTGGGKHTHTDTETTAQTGHWICFGSWFFDLKLSVSMVAQAERSNRVRLGQIGERLVKRSVGQLAPRLSLNPPLADVCTSRGVASTFI